MKVIFVTGSIPPEVCGVGDYTNKLATALLNKGLSVDVLTGQSWRMWSTRQLLERVNSAKPDIVHIQYPTLGYGTNLGPQLLSILRKSVITLHEISMAHPLRQTSLIPFLIRPEQAIFTTEYEKNYTLRYCPWIKEKSQVIPVGSGIKSNTMNRNWHTPFSVINFGMIQPRKGIEHVIRLAELATQQKIGWEFHIAGVVPLGHEEYYNELVQRGENSAIKWHIGLNEDDLVKLFSSMSFSYLPFPDGVSHRRSSLHAVLSNGIPCVTTRGIQTTEDLSQNLLFASSAEATFEVMKKYSSDAKKLQELSVAVRNYSNQFSWPSIADKHIKLYEKIMQKN
jgi:glycosyltransferase involved in cell wall biosynthesis